MEPKRVLVCAPHPDDAEFYAGGLISKMIAEGAKVLILTVTDGRCGSYRIEPDLLASIRKEEAIHASQLMGAEVKFLEYRDSELNAVPTREISEKITWWIRTYKPDTIIAQDAHSRGEVHPDHRALAWAVNDAVQFSNLPNVFPQQMENGLSTHFVVDKYFYTEDPERINQIVDVSSFMEQKLQAMMMHQTQIEFLVEDVIIQAKLARLDFSKFLNSDVDQSPEIALRTAMLAQAASLGSQIGVDYAEGYYYTRFHPYIENLLNSTRSGQ